MIWRKLAQGLCLLVALGWHSDLCGQRATLYEPLSQRDLDIYTYLVPRLPLVEDPNEIILLMREVGTNRERLAIITSKVALAQAMVNGFLSPAQLEEGKVPLYLRPSSEELSLVNRNLRSLLLAQEAARRSEARNSLQDPLTN